MYLMPLAAVAGVTDDHPDGGVIQHLLGQRIWHALNNSRIN